MYTNIYQKGWYINRNKIRFMYQPFIHTLYFATLVVNGLDDYFDEQLELHSLEGK